jgi:hypothetical protein
MAEFADPSSSLIAASDVRAAVRRDGPLVVPVRLKDNLRAASYCVAMDPATRGNAWTLIVLGQWTDENGNDQFEVALAKQWQGTSVGPLSPARVLGEFKPLIAPYGLAGIFTDQHAGDAIRDLGADIGLRVVIVPTVPGSSPEPTAGGTPNPRVLYRTTAYEALAGAFATRSISIPDDRVLVRDLLSVRRVLTRTGVTFDLPSTSDKRHADYAPSLALAITRFGSSAQRVAAQALTAKRERVGFGLAAFGWGESPPELAHLPIGERSAILMRMHHGADSYNDAAETLWSRVARAQAAARAANNAGTQSE